MDDENLCLPCHLCLPYREQPSTRHARYACHAQGMPESQCGMPCCLLSLEPSSASPFTFRTRLKWRPWIARGFSEGHGHIKIHTSKADPHSLYESVVKV